MPDIFPLNPTRCCYCLRRPQTRLSVKAEDGEGGPFISVLAVRTAADNFLNPRILLNHSWRRRKWQTKHINVNCAPNKSEICSLRWTQVKTRPTRCKIGLSGRKIKKPIKLVLVDRLPVAGSQLALNLAPFKCWLISLCNYVPFIKITHLSAKRHNRGVRRSHRKRNKFPSLEKLFGLFSCWHWLVYNEEIGSFNYIGITEPTGRFGWLFCFVHRTKQGASVAGHCQSLFSPVYCCRFSNYFFFFK